MIKIKTWEQIWPPMAPPANFSLGYCVFIGERQLAGAHYYGRKRHGATADKPPFRRLSTRWSRRSLSAVIHQRWPGQWSSIFSPGGIPWSRVSRTTSCKADWEIFDGGYVRGGVIRQSKRATWHRNPMQKSCQNFEKEEASENSKWWTECAKVWCRICYFSCQTKSYVHRVQFSEAHWELITTK